MCLSGYFDVLSLLLPHPYTVKYDLYPSDVVIDVNPTNDLYAITPEENAQYEDFCGFVFRQFYSPPPETLWYYTTGSTFARIIETSQIWSTQISCLNDHTEFRHAVSLVREAIRAYKTEEYDDDTRWLADYVDEGLATDGADYSWFFVMCMSEAEDDLSQWRAYGGGENGVAIGLRSAELLPQTQNRGMLVPVCYIEDKQKALAAEIAKWTIEFFKDGLARREGADRHQWADSFLTAWRERVIYFAPLLKDRAFEKETEWRLIVSLGPDDMQNIQIQQRQSLISRHLPLSFGEKLPINNVMVGPCRHREVSRASVSTYLQAKKYALNGPNEEDAYKVTVTSTKVPFQTT